MGLLLFAIVYLGMATTCNTYALATWFLLYGLYAAATEGVSKAWISNISAKEDTATAIGTYSAFQSICTMLASSLAGLIWWQFGAGAALALSGVMALLVAGYFVLVVPAVR
jgi:MFS-type transporter involved in bile tolerance (Atg22 family)